MSNAKIKQILAAAEKVASKYGVEKTRLSDVSKELGVSHAALYKYFKNKEELFETLVTDWLERTEEKVLHFQVTEGQDRVQAMYDWLSLLAATKRNSFETDPKMFKFYTVYIARSKRVLNRHLDNLRHKAEDILGVTTPRAMLGMALILSFEYFHNPMYSDYWNDPELENYFEAVWQLIEPQLQSLAAQS